MVVGRLAVLPRLEPDGLVEVAQRRGPLLRRQRRVDRRGAAARLRWSAARVAGSVGPLDGPGEGRGRLVEPALPLVELGQRRVGLVGPAA